MNWGWLVLELVLGAWALSLTVYYLGKALLRGVLRTFVKALLGYDW